MTIQDLRTEYETVFGKKPFGGWKEEKLREMLDNKDSNKRETLTEEQLDEKERMEEAARINSRQYKTIDDTLVPIMIKGEPHCLIDNEYVPYKEGQIIVQKRIIERATQKLKQMEEDII